MNRRPFSLFAVPVISLVLLSGCSLTPTASAPSGSVPLAIHVSGQRSIAPGAAGSSILGSPSDSSIRVNTLADAGTRLVVNYGEDPTNLNNQTPVQTSVNGEPIVTELGGLEPDTTYYYAVGLSTSGDFIAGPTEKFVTARNKGTEFRFGVQGDSHPEREGQMFDPTLYQQNLTNASAAKLDFYMMMGDDFSIDKLIEDGTISQDTVNGRYLLQREYLDSLGASTPIFTVNGNHEEAAKYLLDGTTTNPAVFAGFARNTYFPLPTQNEFYSVDPTQVDGVGYLSDYYSFEWGDALFVVIDPYWHSDNPVDNSTAKASAGTTPDKTHGGGKKKTEEAPVQKGKGKNKATPTESSAADTASTNAKRNLWDNTLGADQYDWLVKTLNSSEAKYKFVFTHHVLGTGRGGTEEASLYEWGGFDKNGDFAFTTERPDWQDPIQDLMAENKVTIFFQGHDHLFAQQELGGVVYQTVPCPADPTFTAFNSDAYTSGKILPNSGFLSVEVAPTGVTVNYIATGGENNGKSVYSYTVAAAK